MSHATSSDETAQALFRRVLSHHPTGVSIVTATASDGERIGMVVGSFASVSLDPPLISFMPARSSFTYARLRAATTFPCATVRATQARSQSRAALPISSREAIRSR